MAPKRTIVAEKNRTATYLYIHLTYIQGMVGLMMEHRRKCFQKENNSCIRDYYYILF